LRKDVTAQDVMAAQDVIHFLLPVQLHDDREHKQGMLVDVM
jgi:hypothetical protein